jgi:hypothetical protein
MKICNTRSQSDFPILQLLNSCNSCNSFPLLSLSWIKGIAEAVA